VRAKKTRGRSPYIILYAHGGGYTSGGLNYARILAAKMAISTGYDVISFEYRLAPENKYPAQLNDAMDVWDRIVSRGYSPREVLIAGDSAGGNLALCLTQRLIRQRVSPRALILFSPWANMEAASATYDMYDGLDPILSRTFVERCAEAYMPEGADSSSPEYSPLHGSFRRFPPTLIQVGRTEILLDDSVKLHSRIVSAGGRATLDIEDDGWHVYQQMPVSIASRAMKRVGDFVDEVTASKKR
ncbi:MAG: alpha/beta hydrolase, partial [Eubacterium sp.]|nr:alpha/beta hydrolase [Eubacterium sp.]